MIGHNSHQIQASQQHHHQEQSLPKRKRSWSRAVFSHLQRKGLEKRFEVQKYVTKPDRRQLAPMLGLTDAQVKGFRIYCLFYNKYIVIANNILILFTVEIVISGSFVLSMRLSGDFWVSFLWKVVNSRTEYCTCTRVPRSSATTHSIRNQIL